MKVRINITQSDLDNGKPCSTRECAVALAIQRRLKPKLFADVYDNYFSIYDMKGYYTAGLSQRIVKLISSFDKFLPVKPTSFTTDLPKKVLK
jgi:hypothetical protein